MNSTRPTMTAPKSILVPVDLSDYAEHAVSYAAVLATELDARLTLTVNVNMVEREAIENFAGSSYENIQDAGRSALEALSERLAPGLDSSFDLRFRDFPHEGILEAARSTAADLIVVSSHGRSGVRRVLLGSVAEKLVRHSTVPVVVVPVRA